MTSKNPNDAGYSPFEDENHIFSYEPHEDSIPLNEEVEVLPEETLEEMPEIIVYNPLRRHILIEAWSICNRAMTTYPRKTDELRLKAYYTGFIIDKLLKAEKEYYITRERMSVLLQEKRSNTIHPHFDEEVFHHAFNRVIRLNDGLSLHFKK